MENIYVTFIQIKLITKLTSQKLKSQRQYASLEKLIFCELIYTQLNQKINKIAFKIWVSIISVFTATK